MFVCVSLNPAIDKRLRLDRLQPGRVNRVSEITQAAGGKAVHVAMVLQTLGGDPLWLGFAGGAAGDDLVGGLRKLSIPAEVVPTASGTRTNLEILEDGGIESRRSSRAAADAGVAEAVIQAAFFAIGEDGVGFRDLFEFFFRVGIIGIAVRMVHHRQLAIGALDLNIGGRAGDAEYFVKVAFCISCQKLPQCLVGQIKLIGSTTEQIFSSK